MEKVAYDINLYNYFRMSESKAPYLTIEKYISFIAKFALSGCIDVPKQCSNFYTEEKVCHAEMLIV